MSIEKLPDGRVVLQYKYTEEAQKDLSLLENDDIDELENKLIQAAKEAEDNANRSSDN